MPKFSIIIPVYNSFKYLKRCLDSVFNQSFKDFEVIVINDGSTDESQSVIDSYDNIKCISFKKKKNDGPSYARNVGISKSCGDYILFLDSDDYYESDLLFKLDEALDNHFDIVRFEIQYDINGFKSNVIGCSSVSVFNNGIDAFNCICNYSIVESPCCYAFNRSFFIDNCFSFKEDTLHEDFGLIPLVILKACSVKCIPYVGYNYVIHENSIMTSNDYDRVIKKANDFLIHFSFLIEEVSNLSGDLSLFRSYIANSVILKSTTLNGSDYRKYVHELRKIGAFDMLIDDSFGRKIKKFLVKFSPKIYYKLVRR